MTLVVGVVIAILAVLLLAATALRFRKLRRDQALGRSAKIDRRLVTPPPSPYATSKGFRLLDGSVSDRQPSKPARPRLEPDHEYVFSDTQLPPYEMNNLAHLRHDEHWALSRSARRSRLSPAGMRALLIIVVVVVVLGIAAFYLNHHNHARSSGPTTTIAPPTTTSRPTSIGPPLNGTRLASASAAAPFMAITHGGTVAVIFNKSNGYHLISS